MRDSPAAADPGAADAAARPAPSPAGEDARSGDGDGEARRLGELAQSLAEGAGESLRAARDSATALGHLLRADLALARSALLLGALLSFAAISFVGATWLLLVALAVVALDRSGLPLPAAIAIAAAASLLMALLAGWLARRAFASAGLEATRRQLARLRAGGDDAGGDDEGGNTP